MDFVGKQKRDQTTRASLHAHFETYDEEVWNYSPNSAGYRNVEKRTMKSGDAAPNEGDTKITIRIRDQMSEDTMFKTRKSAKVGTIFKKYAAIKGVHVDELRFML